MCVVAALLGTALVWAQTPHYPVWDSNPNQPASPETQTPTFQPERRLREGTEIKEQLGYFRPVGGRVTFFTADGKDRLVGLENLALERIAQQIDEELTPLQWSVDGRITEFRGANYLIVDRAVLAADAKSSDDPLF